MNAATATIADVMFEIGDERWRQIAEEGYTVEHDDAHIGGELAEAAAFHVMAAASSVVSVQDVPHWPLDLPPKQHPPRCALVIAAALIVAEIERLDRAAAAADHPHPGPPLPGPDPGITGEGGQAA